MSTTPADVAQWMLQKVQRDKDLYQQDAVSEIEDRFGDFIYDNDNGNPAISQAVLREFRKLTYETVVWDRGERCWRLRDKFDGKGRSQD